MVQGPAEFLRALHEHADDRGRLGRGGAAQAVARLSAFASLVIPAELLARTGVALGIREDGVQDLPSVVRLEPSSAAATRYGALGSTQRCSQTPSTGPSSHAAPT